MTDKWKSITKITIIGFFLGIVGQISTFAICSISVIGDKLTKGITEYVVSIISGLFIGIGSGILYKSLKKTFYGLIFGVIAWLIVVIGGTKVIFTFGYSYSITNSFVLIIGLTFFGLCIGVAKNIDTKSWYKIKRSMKGGIIGGIVSSILIFFYFILFDPIELKFGWAGFYVTLVVSMPIIGVLFWFFIELIDNKYNE